MSKLVEEIGELGQVLGKLMGSRGDINHWSGNLNDMLYEELSDVEASIAFLVEKCALDKARIADRVAMKLARFEGWHEKHDPLPGKL